MKDGVMLRKDKNGIDPHDKADDPITRRRLWNCGIAILLACQRRYISPGCSTNHGNNRGPAPAGLAKGSIVTELNNSRQRYFLAAPPSALRK
jgi:hypothetical protein